MAGLGYRREVAAVSSWWSSSDSNGEFVISVTTSPRWARWKWNLEGGGSPEIVVLGAFYKSIHFYMV